MGCHLRLLKVRFSSSLSQRTLVLAALPVVFVVEDWVIGRDGRRRDAFVISDFEVKLLDFIEEFEVVEINNWLGIYFLHK